MFLSRLTFCGDIGKLLVVWRQSWTIEQFPLCTSVPTVVKRSTNLTTEGLHRGEDLSPKGDQPCCSRVYSRICFSLCKLWWSVSQIFQKEGTSRKSMRLST